MIETKIMEELKSSTDAIYERRRSVRNRRCVLIVGVILAVCAFIIGILLGRFAACPSDNQDQSDVKGNGVFLANVPKRLMEDADPTISEEVIQGMKAENIRSNLK